MPRTERLIGGLIATVVVIGLLILLFGPARGLRNDIGAQRGLIAAQLTTLEAQLQVVTLQLEETRSTRELTEQNLAEVTRTRQLTEQSLDEARRTRELAEQTLEQAQRTLVAVETIEGDVETAVALLREQAALTRELLQVARATLEQVREINRKTVPAGSAVP